jgi:hypothetical protein
MNKMDIMLNILAALCSKFSKRKKEKKNNNVYIRRKELHEFINVESIFLACL